LLARYIATSRFDVLPAGVVREAIRSLVNWTGWQHVEARRGDVAG